MIEIEFFVIGIIYKGVIWDTFCGKSGYVAFVNWPIPSSGSEDHWFPVGEGISEVGEFEFLTILVDGDDLGDGVDIRTWEPWWVRRAIKISTHMISNIAKIGYVV
jgi:hypothetical protein